MRPGTRRILIVAGGVLAALGAILAAVWLLRAPIAGLVGRSILERRGLAAEFEVVRLDTTGLAVRDVRLGDGSAIPRLELDYRLGELFGGRIRAVRLTRPQIRAVLDDDGIIVAGFRIGGGPAGRAPRIGLVSVNNALLTVTSPAGDLALEVDLEGGPEQGWRGWAMAEAGALAWRGWAGQVRSGEIEFDMVGDGLLARASLSLANAAGPYGAAEEAMAAATVRLSGLEQGFAQAQGEAAVNLALGGARSSAPEADARRLIAAERWRDIQGAGPLAAPLAAQLADVLAGFDADLALGADIAADTVSVVLQSPLRVGAVHEDGPQMTVRPLDDPEAGLVFSYGRPAAGQPSRGWRAQVGATVTGGLELNARALDIRFAREADGRGALNALRFDADLAQFGDGTTRVAAERLAAEWQRTAQGWRAAASGAALFSGAAFGMTAQDVRLDGDLTLTHEDGTTQVRPRAPDSQARLEAALLQTQAARFTGLAASLVPAFDITGGTWNLAPGAAPISLTAAGVATQSMSLSGVRLEAPRGGLVLSGEGGVFALTGAAPLRFAMDGAQAAGGVWTARNVAAASVTGADGPLLQRTEGGETFLNARAQDLRADSFVLDSGTAFRAVAAADARLRGPVTPEIELDVAAPAVTAIVDTLGRADLALTAAGMNATLSAAPEAPLSIAFNLADGTLAGAALPVVLSQARASGRATFGTELRADVDIENAMVAAPGETPIVAPATLSGGLTAAGGVVRMDMAGAAAGAPPGSITVGLTHNLHAGLGEARVDIPRIVFSQGGPQPQDIIAPLKGLVANVEGPAEAHFRFQWYGNAAQSSGVVTLDNLDIATRFGPVEDVSTTFEMSSLAPLLTAAPQVVTMGRFNPGVPIESGEIRVSLLPDRRIGLESARWPFAGGAIAVQPLVWDPAEPQHRAALLAERIDLTHLVGLFGNQSIAAGGTVSGAMPLLISDGSIEIEDARLSGDEEGFVSYRGQAADAAAAANEQANLAFRALENLRYRVLEVTLDGPVAGEMDLVVTIDGYNPDVLNGFPFRFRIGLNAEFMRLIRDTTQGFRIREQIERSLSEDGTLPESLQDVQMQDGEGAGAATPQTEAPQTGD